MKKNPLESSLEFLDSLNYENVVKNVLVWAPKIHESMLYQAFLCLFFELAKNEDGLEFAFLDSLNFLQERGDSYQALFSHLFKLVKK